MAMNPGALPGMRKGAMMKMKARPAVFTSDRVTADMLALVVQALMVGAAAAMLSAMVVAALVALAA